MFIRKVKTTNGKSKKVYEYLHLVESVRTEDGPRQRLVLNLGNLNIEPSQYKALAQRIEDMLKGQKSFVDFNEELEKHARRAADKIFRKRAKEQQKTEKADYREVDINSLRSGEVRSLGGEYVCHQVWKDLRMNEFLKEKGHTENTIPLMEAVVVGRLMAPGSERHTKWWAENHSAIYEFTGVPSWSSLKSYYRAGDKLYEMKEDIEKHLRVRERDLFSLEEKIILMDPTNTFFEGQVQKNQKAARGRSKERRSDCKLVTLGLIVDEMGFVKASGLFPGNQTEGDTVSTMIESMEKKADFSDTPTIVMDAGLATKENVKYLQENGYHYIVVNRGNPPMEIDYERMEVIKEDREKGVKIEVKRYAQENEVYLVCKSKQKQAKEESMRTWAETRFLENLQHYKEGLTKPRRTKKYEKVLEAIGRQKEKYSRAAKLYEVHVLPEEKEDVASEDLNARDIIWEKKERHGKKKRDEGSYILRTDRKDLSDGEIWNLYAMLTRIEKSFRSMKNELGLRPIYHQTEKRSDAHIFITLLAYHISNIIEHRLRRHGDHRCWNTIRETLQSHSRCTINYRGKDDEGVQRQCFLRICTTPEPEQAAIYKKLGIRSQALPRIKWRTKRDNN